MMMRSERYQIALITLGLIATALFAHFFYREMFPEYRIYQKDYVALEEFRSTYSGEPPPAFTMGVKQIVFEREDKGPAKIDRCISCHVALQLPHFSPTEVARNKAGAVELDDDGTPRLIPNQNYVWARLDKKIGELRDQKVNDQLRSQGETSRVEANLKEADRLAALKVAQVGEHVYDVTKVLRMHPLIGKETRPFEFHPIDDYGCISCHSGNGRALTTDKAHGPVLDEFYEAEFTGHSPHFTEHDERNDPRFAKVFNHKPSDALLFQTTPILIGSLIQAKCVQCHVQGTPSADNSPDIAKLTSDYHRGESLYLSQGCYACHRIAGVARGGIGPELTHAGDSYPWFLKGKLVWPQGDLKTSTMPNYKLDSVEIEDLMTFLLAQHGPTKGISEMEYNNNVKQWEGGRKREWEQPVAPSEMRDLRHSMTIFATQGCAACHRLEGYDSNVGFAVEKADQSDFDAIFRERQWFQALFPEEIRGSDIAAAIESHVAEIDKRIVEGVRKDSLLEEIEAKHPETIESFYSNFRFASRAKNHEIETAIAAADDPKEKAALAAKLQEWKDRVHRILMVYIQEYGLGRLVGPKPDWSGVYRTDAWLMEHFKNPASHVPRSIMPIFPFDDSKFYALTYMLDVLGKRNRDAVIQIWNHKGFDPEYAYKIHCAQCHGDFLQGNGPVATWIYPVPKNLRNTEFLRNLTRENAIQSITHGVKGTPMAPWGEAPKDKMTYDGIPVLNEVEIEKLVDWLYSGVPGGASDRGRHDIPKWNYTPQNAIEELEREGSKLSDEGGQAKYFDAIPNPNKGGEADLYYIKRKYYTVQNLEQGKNFYLMNCAVCHGNDADGAGARASVMVDAKPRMLTNFDWINTRDDLRLLRSIKFGVAGTSMTPWGDFTSSLQRMQLVMYIRSLTFEKAAREQLFEALYNAFALPAAEIERFRIKQYGKVDALKKELDKVKADQVTAERVAQGDEKKVQEALSLYEKGLKMGSDLKALETDDAEIVESKKVVERMREKFQTLGNEILNASLGDNAIWNLFIQTIPLNTPKISFEGEKVVVGTNKEAQAKAETLRAEMIKIIETDIAELERETEILKGKLPSPETEALKRKNVAELAKYKKFLSKIKAEG